MQDALQFVEHVAARARGERVAFDDGIDERRLRLEDGLDEVVDGVARDEVGDVDSPRLTDPVRAILRLPVVGRHPVEVVEHHLRRRGQVEPGSARDDVRDEDPDIGFVLEPIDQRLPHRRRRLAGHDDGRGAELRGELLNRIVEAREDDHLLALIDRAPDEVERGRGLGERERLACLHQEREQLAAAAKLDVPRRARPAVLPGQELEDLLDRTRPGARRHFDRQPRPQLRRQREHVVLRAPEHDAVQLHGQLFDVRGAAGLPAVLSLLRRAVAFRERRESCGRADGPPAAAARRDPEAGW